MTEVDRRSFLRGAGVVAGAGMAGQLFLPDAAASAPGFGLTKFLDPLRIPKSLRHNDVTVESVSTRVKLHSHLPQTAVWAYNGQFPGPTIEVHSHRRLRVAWTNSIDGTMPFVAVRTPLAAPGTPPELLPSNTPGYPRNPDGTPADGTSFIDGVAELPAWTATHVHGAETGGANDGWAHNAVLRSHSQLSEYPNRQPAGTFWYHDHAMAISRWTMYAGLMGMYLVRDTEEAALGLPGGRYEIPLVITDRNLDAGPDGVLTGKLLYKIEYIGTAMVPFFGPFTLVNGTIWPHLDVAAAWYRFRVVNASNARYYRLNLVDDAGAGHNDLVRQIGTDSGLLPRPARLPPDGLTLAPGERADLLADFGRPAVRGRHLRLTNTFPNAAQEPDIMQFRVDARRRPDHFTLPARTSRSYVRLARGTTVPAEHDQVWVALIPPGTRGAGHSQMWELRELTEVPARVPADGVIQLTDPDTGRVRTFQRTAAVFDETVGIFLTQNRWAVWNLLNFGEPAHPMHIHAVRFQTLTRRGFDPDFDLETGGTRRPVSGVRDIPLDDQEKGWKDTVNVNAGEWLALAAKFENVAGEFMYHCHNIEHADEGMMRPFVVHPPQVARFHIHPGHHGGH
jgi:FtsP/CotA-like multicopper oxidase with cupredoxin domain